jgi:hypothetical protein
MQSLAPREPAWEQQGQRAQTNMHSYQNQNPRCGPSNSVNSVQYKQSNHQAREVPFDTQFQDHGKTPLHSNVSISQNDELLHSTLRVSFVMTAGSIFSTRITRAIGQQICILIQ